MKVTKRQLKMIIESNLLNDDINDDAYFEKDNLKFMIKESIRENLRRNYGLLDEEMNEGWIDDAANWISDKFQKTKKFFGDVIDDIKNYFSKKGSDISKSISKHFLDKGNKALKDSLTSPDGQKSLVNLIEYFSDVEDIKDFMKSKSKNPESIDKFFDYLEMKGVDIRELSIKFIGKLIEKNVLDIDLSKDPPVFFKDTVDDAPELISTAFVEALEELHAEFGIDFDDFLTILSGDNSEDESAKKKSEDDNSDKNKRRRIFKRRKDKSGDSGEDVDNSGLEDSDHKNKIGSRVEKKVTKALIKKKIKKLFK